MSDVQTLPGVAWDSRSLNELKRQAGRDPQGYARQVAKQVEGLFVQMMLKSMRDALPQDGMLSNDHSRLCTSLYDQQLAQQIAARGTGLADSIVKQMQTPQMPDKSVGTWPLPLDNTFVNTLPPVMVEQMMRKALPRVPAPNSTMSGDSVGFIAQLAQPAQIASQQSGIPWHLILAQAALESGWGQRQILTREGKPGFNIFAIKAGDSWQGKTTDVMTTEYENGVAYQVRQKFRVYDSYQEALHDYVRLLSSNPRYSAVVSALTAEQGAQALQQSGYATDPHYAQKLVSVIRQFKRAGEKAVKAYRQDLSTLF